MVQFDNQYRQIKIKIVYYGPALSGKTTCLQEIHRVVDPERRTKLYSFNTADDRTLFFDLLSLDLGRIRGYRLAIQLYTVPGQVQYNATRRAVLTGTDGVVFVADSQASQREANVASLANMWVNLEANGFDRSKVPVVFMFNKQDLNPLVPIEELEKTLNPGHAPSFPSIAPSGEGVMEGFAAIAEETLAAVAEKLGVGTDKRTLAGLRDQVRRAVQPLLSKSPTPGLAEDLAVLRPAAAAQGEKPLSTDNLVSEAVRANVIMTDLNALLDNLRRQLERKVRVLAGIAEFSREVGAKPDPSGVLEYLLESSAALLDVSAAAVLLVPSSGGLEQTAIRGLGKDPLLAVTADTGQPLAVEIANDCEPVLIARELQSEDAGPLLSAVEEAGFSSALAAPLSSQGRVIGLFTAYGGADRVPLDETDLQLAGVLAGAAAMGYTNGLAWERLRSLNQGLEAKIAARTRELEESLEQVQRLNAELAEKNALVEEAYGKLADLDKVKNELTLRIANDLRTPVKALLTTAQLLEQMGPGQVEKMQRYAAIIGEKTGELEEVMENVSQASLLAAADGEITRRATAVQELLKQALARLRDRAKRRGVNLHVFITSGLDWIECEPDLMAAAVRAVVKNAIDFNHEGGEVKVEARRASVNGRSLVGFRVTDTGVGIPEADQARVFEPFWRGEKAGAGGVTGAGLGLAVAQRVVESHGGTIRLESTVGEGTTVSILLP